MAIKSSVQIFLPSNSSVPNERLPTIAKHIRVDRSDQNRSNSSSIPTPVPRLWSSTYRRWLFRRTDRMADPAVRHYSMRYRWNFAAQTFASDTAAHVCTDISCPVNEQEHIKVHFIVGKTRCIPCVQHVRNSIFGIQIFQDEWSADVNQRIIAEVMRPHHYFGHIVHVHFGHPRVSVFNYILHDGWSNVTYTNFTLGTVVQRGREERTGTERLPSAQHGINREKKTLIQYARTQHAHTLPKIITRSAQDYAMHVNIFAVI